jgi:chemotaxis protein CheC
MSRALGEAEIDALREIGSIGAGTAATALSRMTGVPVAMGVPSVALLPVEEIADRVGPADAVIAAAFLGVRGDVTGHMILAMADQAARAVIGLLLGGIGTPSTAAAGAFSVMEMSALQETGNILAGSYLTALSQVTGLRLEATPPAVGVDLAGALIGAAVAEVAMSADRAILIGSALGPS